VPGFEPTTTQSNNNVCKRTKACAGTTIIVTELRFTGYVEI
jgi:hypothetical protein